MKFIYLVDEGTVVGYETFHMKFITEGIYKNVLSIIVDGEEYGPSLVDCMFYSGFYSEYALNYSVKGKSRVILRGNITYEDDFL